MVTISVGIVTARGEILTRRSRARNSRSVVRDTLVAVVTDPAEASRQFSSLSEPELALVLQHGTAQKLGTALVSCLRSASMPVPGWLEAHRFMVATRKATIMNTLAVIAPALTQSGIPWAVLKGPVIAASFPDPHVREFGDLDILVPGPRLSDFIAVLSSVGIDDMNRNWERYVRYGVAEFPAFIGGAPLDLHWHLIGLARTRKRFSIDMAQILERLSPVTLNGTACHRLDSEDHLAHVALHAGLSGAGSLGLLRDVHETVRIGAIDWDEFATRASEAGIAPLVGQVLSRCRHVLGTSVPSGVCEQLAPSSMLDLRTWLDRTARPGSARAENAFSGFIVSSSRSGSVATAARAFELLGERTSGLAGHRPRWSAYDPEGPLYWDSDTTSSGGLSRYLDLASGET